MISDYPHFSDTACYFKILSCDFKNLLSSAKLLIVLIAKIYIQFSHLCSSEHMAYIQQIFADNRPTRLLT